MIQVQKIILILIFLCLLHSALDAQGQSIFDGEIPNQTDVDASLKRAKELRNKSILTVEEILQLYYAEKKIGRCVWGPSPGINDSVLQGMKLFGFYVDSILANRCVDYIESERKRFRVVDDAWKGEENFWEPNEDLLVRAKEAYPNSKATFEIEFDIEFNQFIRQFNIDMDAKGKTCEQYVKEILEDNGDVYRETYSEEEISGWQEECVYRRDEFERGRQKLLKKFRNAPFTKKLQDIDITTIVVYHSVC